MEAIVDEGSGSVQCVECAHDPRWECRESGWQRDGCPSCGQVVLLSVPAAQNWDGERIALEYSKGVVRTVRHDESRELWEFGKNAGGSGNPQREIGGKVDDLLGEKRYR